MDPIFVVGFFLKFFFHSGFRLQKIFENSFVKRHTRDFLVLCSELACDLWHERTSTSIFLLLKFINKSEEFWEFDMITSQHSR